MNNIMKLADAYAQHKYVNGAEGRGPDAPEARTGYARAALQAALEQQAAEITELKESVSDLRAAATILKEERDALQAEVEQLTAALSNKNKWLGDCAQKLQASNAKLSAMEKQEPVGEVSGNDWSSAILYRDLEPGSPVYAAPKVAQPPEALEALFTNIDHAISSGAWKVQEGSQTWETIQEAKAAIGGQQP